MKSYVKFDAMDHAILNSYKSILDGLSLFLGNGFEFVLHSLEDLDSSAIKVVNGQFSNRAEGAPITDVAMQLLKEIKQSGNNNKNMVYVNNQNGRPPIKSATLPITGFNGKIIGLLCINFHLSIPLHDFLGGLFNVYDEKIIKPINENYATNSEYLITSALDLAKNEVHNNDKITASNHNKMIISLLYERGIFEMKDAVHIVASDLKISKNTVYLHIRNCSKQA
ncbi:TPA: PAS domain-containing protein [Klebsiella quasipneumoniae subsp. quasipneumoniae]|nr:PAS domain-containing protein [Klebsiella quasipneumoniae subsp. quasipneumoniae]HCJ7666353.1 PAS domain-containing protein [Enterobacter hormaechei subsp. xiangfangensis]